MSAAAAAAAAASRCEASAASADRTATCTGADAVDVGTAAQLVHTTFGVVQQRVQMVAQRFGAFD